MSASLLHTALQNLTVAQAIHHPSHTPRAGSGAGSPAGARTPTSGTSEDEGEVGGGGGGARGGGGSGARSGGAGGDAVSAKARAHALDMVKVGKGTAPSTPVGGLRGLAARRVGGRDPLRAFPTHVAVRIFLQLDIRSLARCDRVCRRWHKSSTLNYVWFLQNRALVLPESPGTPALRVRYIDAETSYVDPYASGPSLRALPPVPPPTQAAPVWTRAESKRSWRLAFRATLLPGRGDGARVDVGALGSGRASAASSGWSTPHAHRGAGAGHAGRWADGELGAASGSAPATPDKAAMREAYKSLGGRKVASKRRMGGQHGRRDRTGADDDGRFDAPW